MIFKGKPYHRRPEIWGIRHYQSWLTHLCYHKGLTRYTFSPYPPWGPVEVISDIKLKWVFYDMFYPLDLNEWRQPLQLYKICPNTLIWASSQSLLLEYLRGVMESRYTELALYCTKNKCPRTDPVFLPISEVCDGTVSLMYNCQRAGRKSISWIFNRPGVAGAVL